MKKCSKCGLTISDDAQYCPSCGRSQAEGVFKVAEAAGMLGRGALRTGAGAFCSGVGGVFFYAILFSFPNKYGFDIAGSNGAILTFGISCAVIGGVFSAPSEKFMWLVGFWFVYGFISFFIYILSGSSLYMLGKVIYVFFLIIVLPLTWIWYIVRKGLVVATPKKVGILKSTKKELTETMAGSIRHIKRFGRR